MSKTAIRIERFDDGMNPDFRSDRGVQRIQHFKTHPYKLVPQLSTEANESKSLGIKRFAYAPWLTGYNLFGLGVNASNHPAVYMKDTTGADVINNGWSTPSGGDGAASGSLGTNNILFPYKNYLHFFSGGTNLSRYLAVGSPALTLNYQSITYGTVADPVHHPADDCAYFFADNKVYRLNGSSWEGEVLALPDNLKIVSGNAVGNFLEIACAPKSGFGPSVSYLWDRDSSLSTVAGQIHWGEGNIIHTGYLKGVLVGVIDYFTSSIFGHDKGKVIIKPANGEWEPRVFEVDGTDAGNFTGNKHIVDDMLHFLRLTRGGQTLEGIWAVDSRGRVSIPVSDEDVSTGRIQGIYKTGEYWWLAHSGDGSVNRTNDQNTYAYTSILETNVIGKADEQSQFYGATIPFEPLPSGASVTLKFKKVGESSWTTMKTVSTAGATTLSAIKSGVSKAPVFNEIQYRVESTGGAVIAAGLEFVHETHDKKPYA